MSKEMVSSFEARLAKLELSLSNIHECLNTLDDQVGEHNTNVVAVVVKGRLQQTFHIFANSTKQAMDDFKEIVKVQVNFMKAKLIKVYKDVTLCKTAITLSIALSSVPRVWVSRVCTRI